MTVGQLIGVLSKHDPSLPVWSAKESKPAGPVMTVDAGWMFMDDFEGTGRPERQVVVDEEDTTPDAESIVVLWVDDV
tara:strand:- start:963 stop:1193 length:231 start_codon:yes stop_codon:yes gene_type:complete